MSLTKKRCYSDEDMSLLQVLIGSCCKGCSSGSSCVICTKVNRVDYTKYHELFKQHNLIEVFKAYKRGSRVALARYNLEVVKDQLVQIDMARRREIIAEEDKTVS